MDNQPRRVSLKVAFAAGATLGLAMLLWQGEFGPLTHWALWVEAIGMVLGAAVPLGLLGAAAAWTWNKLAARKS